MVHSLGVKESVVAGGPLQHFFPAVEGVRFLRIRRMVELLEAVLLEETVIELLAPSERPEENPVRILDVDGRAL